MSELRYRHDQTPWDLIAITESWLSLDILDSEVALPGLSIIRRDRITKGGGVVLYHRSDLVCEPIDHPNLAVKDTLFCQVSLADNDKCLLGIIYRPPNSDTLKDDAILLAMQHVSSLNYSHKLIMGDFNTPDFTDQTSQGSKFKVSLLELSHSAPLYNHVSNSTRFRGSDTPSILDLILTNEELMIETIRYHAPLGRSDHIVLLFDFVCYAHMNVEPEYRTKRVTDIPCLLGLASASDWDFLGALPTNEAWNTLVHRLHTLISAASCTKTVRTKRKPKEFIRSRTRKWMSMRDNAWRQHRTNPSRTSWSEYTTLRNHCTSLVRSDKTSWQSSLVSKFATNRKLLYRHINQLRKVKHGIPPLSTDRGLTQSLKETADTLLLQYASVQSQPNTACPTPTAKHITNGINAITFTPEAVALKLKTLRKHSSAGIDDIRPSIVSLLADILADPLAHFFTKLLNECSMPDHWRQGIITPVYKGGKRSDPANYRPITLLPILSKVMESVVADQLRSYLESHNILADDQHGFRRGRSCLTNLLLTRDNWTKDLDEGIEVNVVYLDFSKAFDRVQHHILLHKLSTYGISGTLLQWLHCYLQHRTISVRVSGTLSDSSHTPCGVPQGSVLGPLLFLAFINDLPASLLSSCMLFADDIKLWRAIRSSTDQSTLQTDLDTAFAWSTDNQLPFNWTKCHVLQLRPTTSTIRNYMLGPHLLQTTASEKDLGVIIQQDLGNSAQCKKAADTANKHVKLFRRALGQLEKPVLSTLVTAYIRPHVEYSVQAWSPWLKRDERLLEQAQRRSTKLVRGLQHLPYQDRLAVLSLYSVTYRRLRGDLILTYQALHVPGHPCRSLLTLANTTNLRGHELKLQHQYSHLDCRKYYFSLRVCRPWNALPAEVITAPSLETFKLRLDSHLRELHFVHA